MKKRIINPAFGVFSMLIFLILVAITPVVASDNSYPQEAVQNKANTEETPGITPATELIWKSEIVNPSGNPVIYKDLIIIGNRSGWLTAVNRKTGKRVWTSGETSLELNTHTTPLIYQDRVVYLHGNTDNHAIFEVRWASNGTLDRSWDTGLVCNQAVESSPVLIDDRLGTFVWGTGNEDTQCDISGGRIRVVSFWRDGKRDQDVHTLFNTKGTVSSTPTFADGHLFFGDDTGRVYSIIPHYYTSIDSQEGSKNQSLASEVWEAWIGTRVISSPAVSDNFVYITSWGEPFTLYALDERTGGVNWKYEHYTFAAGSPVINKNIVYVVDEDGAQLSAFNTRDGTPVWSRALGSSISYGFPTITNDILYVGTDNGDLIILDPASGNIIGGYRASESIQSTAVIEEDIIYFTTADGHLYAVGPKTQPPEIEWQKPIGGSKDDYAEFASKTSDGGVIVGGETTSSDGDIDPAKFHGLQDIIITKFGSDSTIQWSRLYGGTDGESFLRQILSVDDGYLLVGSTSATDGDFQNATHHGWSSNEDILLMKIDRNDGHIIWTHCYGGSGNDVGMWSTLTNDKSSVVIVGFSDSTDGDFLNLNKSRENTDDAFAMNIDLNTQKMTKAMMYGGSNDDEATQVERIQGGSGFVISGYTHSNDLDVAGKNHSESNGTTDGWIFFVDTNLNLIQDKNWLFGGSLDEELWGLQWVGNGNILAIGSAYSGMLDGDIPPSKHGSPGTSDIWLLQINPADGSIILNRCYGGSGDEEGSGIRATEGRYFLVGSTQSNNGDVPFNHGSAGKADLWLIKVDPDFNIIYQKTFGGSDDDYGKRLGVQNAQFVMQDGYIIGTTYSNNDDVTGNHGNGDIWLLKLKAANGETLW